MSEKASKESQYSLAPPLSTKARVGGDKKRFEVKISGLYAAPIVTVPFNQQRKDSFFSPPWMAHNFRES